MRALLSITILLAIGCNQNGGEVERARAAAAVAFASATDDTPLEQPSLPIKPPKVERSVLAEPETPQPTLADPLRKTAPILIAVKPAKPTIKDGQLSPGRQWRYSAARNAWLPVKQPGPNWVQVGQHAATPGHLVNAHGLDPRTVAKMTPAERNIAHSNAHNSEARARKPVAASNCPGGRCPAPSYQPRGIFRRR